MGINKCFVLPQLTQRAWRRKLSRGYLVLEHWIILAIKLLCIPAGQLARCWTGRLPPAPSLAPLTTPLSLSGSLHRFQQISYCAGWRRGGRGEGWWGIIIWILLFTHRILHPVLSPGTSSADTAATTHRGNTREEWELRSPKSYYLVDHAMTVHMTGPEFHRHYTELHRRGAGPSLSQTIRRQSSVDGSCWTVAALFVTE